jgi:YidC/Oxa1 family membrane protein insertase
MGMDRNTVIGFVLIGVLLIGMFVINSRSRLAYEGQQKKIADSIAALKPKNVETRTANNVQSALPSVQQGSFQVSAPAPSITYIENSVLKIGFTNKGGQPQHVILKKYKKADGSPVVLQKEGFDKLSYTINAGPNQTQETANLIFTQEPLVTNPDKSQVITFSLADSTGKKINHQYTIRPDDYLIDLNISVTGSDKLFSQPMINLLWQAEAPQIEKNYKYEATQTFICYYKDDNYDFEYIGSDDDLSLSKPVDWVSVKSQFFARSLLAKNKFSSAPTAWTVPGDTNQAYLVRSVTQAKIPLQPGNVAAIPLQLYYGPSDYNILKKYNNHMENIVPYGNGVFAFVKYINRYLLLPVFDFFQRYIGSMGMVILLLTLFIRLITSPILYKSYLSGAKMKALKPEIDVLKAKFTDPHTKQLDQQAFSMEQMKLWRTAGVSPLGGCLPALLQIPIFMSLYFFFQSNIDLRGKNFLWADDLSTYDSIAKLPFEIWQYGDHVSLFTLTATATSLLISIYSMSSMQDNTNPMMKYMPYIFPFMLLFVFNPLPAALTWYYTVSNVITLILQFIIQNYIINHEKILVQINENRKKPVKQSKFQERLQAMQEAQKKMQEMKNKSSKVR